MENNESKPIETTASPIVIKSEANQASSKIESMIEKIDLTDIKKNGQLLIGIIIGLALLIGGFSYWRSSSKAKDAENHRELGVAYVYLSMGRQDSATAFLQNYLSKSRPALAVSKANLLLGKSLYMQAKYADALEAYRKVNSSIPLLHAGSLIGQAASNMQLSDYASAEKALTTVIEKYQKETGDMQERGMGRESADVVPGLAGAMFKLGLCYQQLGKNEDATETFKALLKAYPNSAEAGKAQRILAALS